MAKRPTPFHPTSADVLIEQAEAKFQNGIEAYENNQPEAARDAFDDAVDLMLQASDGPTDRRLYEDKLDQMVDSIHRYDLAGLGAGAPVDEAEFERAPIDDIIRMTFPVNPAIKGKVNDEVKTTSSALPLAVNDAVLSYINYFSGRGHRTIVAGLERAGRYQPMISRILAEEGVPQELIHLAQAESGFLPRAVSNKAAAGMWQFVEWRGNQYGLRQTPLTDDRLDPEKATRAAAHHLHDLYNEFGDWYLAIAAYNCGPMAIQKAVERTGYADFWELRSRGALPLETSNYVPIILAMTIMSKNAAEYGLTDVHPEAALEYDTVRVSSTTNLALVGDLTDTPVSQLLEMNPALIKSVAPADYDLRVPKSTGDKLQAALDLFPSDRRATWRMHRVEAGETVASIAQRYNTSVNSIAQANRLDDGTATAGARLMIPVAERQEVTKRFGRGSLKSLRAAAHGSSPQHHATFRMVSTRTSARHTGTSLSARLHHPTIKHRA